MFSTFTADSRGLDPEAKQALLLEADRRRVATTREGVHQWNVPAEELGDAPPNSVELMWHAISSMRSSPTMRW